MKRTVCLLIALIIVCFLLSCGESVSSRSKSGGKTVEEVLNEKATDNTEKATEEVTEKATEEVTEKATETAAETVPSETEDFLSAAKNGDIDVDLTILTPTLVYAQVNDMLMYPDKYVGKKVRMRGPFAVYETEERNYFAVIISDATACCSQGIEFLLTDERSYPSEYPEKGAEITVTGVFHTYAEGQLTYPELYDATME